MAGRVGVALFEERPAAFLRCLGDRWAPFRVDVIELRLGLDMNAWRQAWKVILSLPQRIRRKVGVEVL